MYTLFIVDLIHKKLQHFLNNKIWMKILLDKILLGTKFWYAFQVDSS